MAAPDLPGGNSPATDPIEPKGLGFTLAVLFWFYKAPDICEERLRHLRLLNPGLRIFGLYGGPVGDAPAMEKRLGPLLDDLYLFEGARDDLWKWRHGDQLIAAWHRDRGHRLSWNTLVIVQWDMLILRPVTETFAMLRPGEALFSGFRPAAEVTGWWGWLDPARPDRQPDLDAFRAFLRDRLDYDGPLWCCLFIVVCLPRAFLDRYVAIGHPEAGFLEYKLPTLAKAFGIPVRTEHPFKPWWGADPATRSAPPEARLLNATGADIPIEIVRAERDAGRAQVFHPFRQPFPG